MSLSAVSLSSLDVMSQAFAQSDPNSAPVIVPPTIADSYPELVELQLDFGVTDADADQTHTFALTGTDSNLVDNFDTATGILVWTPAENEDDTYRFTVTVSDDHAADPQSNSHTFDLVISEVNTAPVLEQIGAITGTAGTAITFTASATDADLPANALTFTLAAGTSGQVPDGATIDETSGVFEWTPEESDVGANTFDVVVSDGTVTDSQTVTATVASADTPTTYTPISPLTLDEDDPRTEIDLDDHFTDPDTSSLAYSIAVTKDSEPFDDSNVIGIGNGETFYVDPNFESHGVYAVTITAREGSNTPATGTVTVTINNANRAVSQYAGSAITVNEQESSSFNIAVIGVRDPDGPTTCEKTSGPADITVTGSCVINYAIGETLGGSSFDLVIRVTGTNDAGAPEAGVDIVDVTIPLTISELNSAPVGTTIPSQTATQDAPFTLNTSQYFSDSDIFGSDTPDTLTYSLGGTPPTWLSIDGTTGVLSGTLTQEILDDAPTDQVTIQVIATDTTGRTASESFALTLVDTNDLPDLTVPTIAASYPEQAQLQLSFGVTDEDTSQTHTFALTGTGSELVGSFDAGTGALVWTPAENEDGPYRFTVTVTDDHATSPQSDSHTFDLVISEVNTTPDIALASFTAVDEETALSAPLNVIGPTVTDPDVIGGIADELTFSFVGDTPDGLSIDSSTGQMAWTPTERQDGVYDITVRVTDGESPATDTIEITVNEVAAPPTGTTIPSQTAQQDAPFTLDLTPYFSDDDIIDGDADVISYALDSPPGWLSVNGGTGLVSGTATNEIIAGVPSNQLMITVIATDIALAEARQSFALMLANVNDPPVLAEIGELSGEEHAPITFTATATDVDVPADTLTFSLDAGTSGSVPTGAAIDPTTGVFTWTPDESQGGMDHTFDVRVFDSTVHDSETITVTVSETNSPPVLDAIGQQTGDENTPITFTASANDPDVPPDTLTFSLTDGASGSVPPTAAINPASGAFTWTPDESQGGTMHTFDVVVSDGTVSDSQTVTVTVNDINDAPDLTVPTIASAYPELVEFRLDFGVTDSDVPEQSHTFALSGTDSTLVGSFDAATGVLVWTPAENEDGPYRFTVTVTDDYSGNALSDSHTFDLVISEVNTTPDLTLASVAAVDEETVWDAALVGPTATDPDIIGGTADELTFSFVGNTPDGLTIDSSTGQMAWTPTERQDGDHNITVQVTDGESPVTNTIAVTVNEIAKSPVGTTIPAQTVLQDISFTLDASPFFSDDDVIAGNPDVITYSLDSPPDWLSINSGNGRFSGTATQDVINDTPGNEVQVTIVASDIAGAQAEEMFTLGLTDTNDEPVALSTLPTTHTVDEDTVNDTLDILSHYTDADPGSTLTLAIDNGRGFATADGDNLVFNPENDHVGTNEVTFTVQDVAGTPFNTGTVTVTVNNVNDAPTALVESLDSTFNEEFTQADDVEELFADVDVGDTLTITHDGPDFVTFPGNTVYSVMPTYDDAGMYAFTIVATDSGGATASIPVTYVVTNVNRAPTLQLPENLHLVPGTSYTFDLNELFEDLDGDDVEFRFTYDGEMVPQEAFAIDYPMITFTLPINADLSKELVATIEDSDPEPLTDTETVQYTYQPLTIPTIPEGDRMMPDPESATDQASASFDDESIPNVEIQPAASQTFEYSIVYYDLPAPSLARVYSPDVTDEQLTTFNRNPIQFLNGVVDIDASATGRTLVTLTYEEPVGLDESALSIWHFEKGRWSQLSSQTLDTDANTVSGYTRSFSPFAIGTMLDEPRTDRSSDSIEHLKAPTFGTSKLNNNQVVECGYSMDGRCIDVLGYHEEYLREIIQTNSTHDFTLKAFGQSPIKQFQIGFGVSGVGEPVNNAEAIIRVAVTQDSKSAYSVDTVEITDEHNTIDFEPQNAGVQKVACTDDNNNIDNSKTPQCVELTLNGVLFREQFHSEPFVIHVTDSSRRSSHNYMNEGLLVQGTSLNPAPTASKLGMPVGTSDLVSFELTRTDKLADIWTDQFGHTWTQNSFGTWLQLTFPDVRHDSGDGAQQPAKVMTRVHSDFADLVMGQQNRATLVFDAAGITNFHAPEAFSHDYYGTEHDLTKIQKLADQLKVEQERAQKTLDAIMGRHSHTEGL